MHFSINLYAADILEANMININWSEKWSAGLELFAYEQRKANISGDYSMELTMLDYSDFNLQHTPKAQAILFEESARIGSEKGFHKDWVDANLWIAKAKYNSKFKIPNDDVEYVVTQGMFSGTKSTDVINTHLNIAYTNVATRLVKRYRNIESENILRTHQGDDIWIINSKRHWAACLYYVMNRMGFVFNPIKQMFGHNRGEFLWWLLDLVNMQYVVAPYHSYLN